MRALLMTSVLASSLILAGAAAAQLRTAMTHSRRRQIGERAGKGQYGDVRLGTGYNHGLQFIFSGHCL